MGEGWGGDPDAHGLLLESRVVPGSVRDDLARIEHDGAALMQEAKYLIHGEIETERRLVHEHRDAAHVEAVVHPFHQSEHAVTTDLYTLRFASTTRGEDHVGEPLLLHTSSAMHELPETRLPRPIDHRRLHDGRDALYPFLGVYLVHRYERCTELQAPGQGDHEFRFLMSVYHHRHVSTYAHAPGFRDPAPHGAPEFLPAKRGVAADDRGSLLILVAFDELAVFNIETHSSLQRATAAEDVQRHHYQEQV